MANGQFDSLQIVAEQRMQRYIHQAEIDHLLAEKHPRGENGRSRQALSHLGNGLASLGEWIKLLDRRGPRPIREQSGT